MSQFTEREQKLLAAACQSFEGEPKFAQISGLAVGSARNAWYALKKKLDAPADAVSGTAPGVTPKTINKSAKKRVAALRSNGSDDEELFTPSKKPKGPTGIKRMAKGKAAVKAIKDDDDEEEDGFVKVKVKNEEFEEL
ncbi:hypothetical protein E4T39_02450 [Aureobasidium subglaciale]|nr:hypothetical protein E4T39_02450 [Aureobasidium subglaciale]